MYLGQTCVHYTSTCACMQVSMCVHMYAQVYVCMCVLMCVCLCIAASQAGGQGCSVGSGAPRPFSTQSLGTSTHSGAARLCGPWKGYPSPCSPHPHCTSPFSSASKMHPLGPG